MIVRVTLHGCDDCTELEIDVTPEQLEFLKILSTKLTETSEYRCQPIMSVKEMVEKANE